jgi:hypothetical protein
MPPAHDPALAVAALLDEGAIKAGSDGSIYYLPHPTGTDPDAWPAPVAVQSPSFLRVLHRIAGVPPVRRLARDVLQAVEAASEGIVHVRSWTWKEADAICYCVAPSYVVRLGADGVRFVPAVTQTSLAVPPRDFDPIPASELATALASASPSHVAAIDAVVGYLPPPGVETTPQATQAVLLLAWWVGLFADGVAQGRPILGVCGGKGSGKTVTARLLGKLFFGTSYEVSGGVGGGRAVKDLVAGLATRPLHVADDQNDVPREIIDTLCRIATGTRIELATMHETLALSTFSARSNAVITSNRPAWALRDDLLDRMIPLIFRRADTETSWTEQDRADRVTARRVQAFADVFASVVATIADDRRWSPVTRFADWETFVRRCADVGGWGGALHDALLRLAPARVALACWADPFVAALWSIADELREQPRWLTAAELYDAVILRLGGIVSSASAERPSGRALSNAKALGRFLGDIERSGSTVVDIVRGPTVQGAATWCLLPKA